MLELTGEKAAIKDWYINDYMMGDESFSAEFEEFWEPSDSRNPEELSWEDGMEAHNQEIYKDYEPTEPTPHDPYGRRAV